MKKRNLTKGLFSLFLLTLAVVLHAQPNRQLVELLVAPEHTDWTYESGEQVNFEVRVVKDNQLLTDISINYSLGYEQMPPSREGTMNLKDGTGTIKGIKASNPGFIRCYATVSYEGNEYRGSGTAGIAPDLIQPTVEMPDDFDTFWDNAMEELSTYPIDAKVTLMPELCTPDINVYHVNLQNIRMPHAWQGNSRFYGMLSVPKKTGKYPAILNVPGAGVRAYGRDDRAANGVIVFKVGIHGMPVNQDDEVYRSLGVSSLSGYHRYNMENKDHYYFKRVYLGCVRAIDYIFTLPEFDGENLAVTGGSQGGALSIVTAGLDSRVKYLAAFYPALCDLTGYLNGRAGGWPHLFKSNEEKQHEAWKNTVKYYDVVNFARKLNIPGWYSWGYNDNVCPPTSMYGAYNVITAEKELHPYFETGHWTFPEQRELANEWLFNMLGVDEGE